MGNKEKKQIFLFDFIGTWQVPGLNMTLQGHLFVKKSRLYLKLFTDRTFEAQSLSDGIKVEFNNYSIIIGDIKGNRKCTLYKCKWAGCKQMSLAQYCLKYEIQFVFLNALIENQERLLVQSAKLRFSHLSSWYDGSKSIGRVSPHTGVFINGKEQSPDTTNKQKLVEITNNINFIFIDSFERREIQLGSSYEISFRKYLNIEFKIPVDFEELISTAAYFSNLLEVSLFQQVPFCVLDVQFNEEAYQHLKCNPYNNVTRSIVLNYSLLNKRKIIDDVVGKQYMLFSGWTFNATALDEIIKKWFLNRNYAHVYDYFIDSHLWEVRSIHFVTNVMFNNKFLNMLHGVEGFYRLFYINDKSDNTGFASKKEEVLKFVKDPDLKKWLNDNFNPPKYKNETLGEKLEHLIDDFKPFLIPRFGNIEITKNFFLKAVKYRNILSHGAQRTTDQGNEFSQLFFAIQYLLALCILKSIGVDDPGKTTSGNMNLNDSARSIINYVNKNIHKYDMRH